MKRVWVVSLVPAMLMSCAGSAKYMRELPPGTSLEAPADKAVIVFARPSGMAFLQNFHILDQNGTWLGEAVARSSFAVALPAGDYLFVGWGVNTEAIRATVAAGRTYYVRVEAKVVPGVVLVELEAMKMGSSDWNDLRGWLKDGRRLEPLPEGRVANAALEDTARIEDHDPADRVRRALESWKEYSLEEKEERTLRVEDGAIGPAIDKQL